jgi:hypothetical protein
MSRSRDEIAQDIVDQLKPRRRGVGDPRPEILHYIERTARLAVELRPVLRTKEIREAAERADKAVAVLERELGGVDLGREQFRRRQHVIGPNQRLGLVQRLAAHQAIALIEQLSQKPAVLTNGGNTHCVARLIYEAVTGQAASADALLRPVKTVMKWRRHVDPRGHF